MPIAPVVTQKDTNALVSLDKTSADTQTAAIAELERENVQRKLEIEELRKTLLSCEEKMRQLTYSVARTLAAPVNHSTDVARSPSNSPRLWRGG